MQLISTTATRFGGDNAFDPTQNILGGCRYLRWLLDAFDGDVTLALTGYNAGKGAVVRQQDVSPYWETQRHVKNVLARWGRAGRSAPATPTTAAVAEFGERQSWATLVAANRRIKSVIDNRP